MPEVWEEIGKWALLVAALAGGLKGTQFLWNQLRKGGNRWVLWFDEHRRIRTTMAALTDDEGWPNGAESIKESHENLYNRVSNIEGKVDEVANDIRNLRNIVVQDIERNE